MYGSAASSIDKNEGVVMHFFGYPHIGQASLRDWHSRCFCLGTQLFPWNEVPYIFEYRSTSNISRGKFVAINQGFFIASNISRAEK